MNRLLCGRGRANFKSQQHHQPQPLVTNDSRFGGQFVIAHLLIPSASLPLDDDSGFKAPSLTSDPQPPDPPNQSPSAVLFSDTSGSVLTAPRPLAPDTCSAHMVMYSYWSAVGDTS